VDETPDYVPRTRPRSTARVIGTLLLVTLLAGFLLVQCVRLYANSAPRPTLEVRRSELEVNVPKLYPLPSMGADVAGRTHGVWVTLFENGDATAFSTKDPGSGCRVAWLISSPLPEYPRAYRDPCGGGTYTSDGVAVFGPTPRNLDSYTIRVEATRLVVELETLRQGAPRAGWISGSTTPTPAR
jgi:Rieske Fe-S protein